MIVVVVVYILANFACIGYFARFRRDDFNWFLHGVAPLLGIAAFVPALLTAAGLPVFSFVTTLTPPASYAGPVAGAWLLIGLLYLAYLWRNKKQRVLDLNLVHMEVQTEGEAQ